MTKILGALLLTLLANVAAHTLSTPLEISADDLATGMNNGFFHVVVDVRTKEEFELMGHIENATLVEMLASAGTLSEVTNASHLAGCETCNIAVYCRSGARSAVASNYLAENGFIHVYDAGGIVDWTTSGRAVVKSLSVTPPCAVQPANDTCIPISAW